MRVTDMQHARVVNAKRWEDKDEGTVVCEFENPADDQEFVLPLSELRPHGYDEAGGDQSGVDLAAWLDDQS